MKKTISIFLASAMLLASLSACSSEPSTETTTPDSTGGEGAVTTPSPTPSENKESVELYVVTSFGGTDGNRVNYENAYKSYQTASGNTVLDSSGTSDEVWKSEIMVGFETGTEPDVLFYFAGADANQMIKDDKVLSLEEIREVYPDYASNMLDDRLPTSPVDGDNYCVPVNGYWEGMYVNKTVLAEAGVEIPSADYTWDQFLVDCETIKNAGFTPIAVSLAQVPHYWFEFTTLNNGNVENHLNQPTSISDEIGTKWVAGMNDLKELYDKGYLPRNTLTANDDETVQMMADDEAAFLIDGSWKLGWFKDNAAVEEFTVVNVPSKGERSTTDSIGGISMGYYITRQAWEDETKREAAVEFVQAMTTDEVVSNFGVTSLTALKNEPVKPDNLTQLEEDAIALMRDSDYVDATQDGINSEMRQALFASVKEVMSGAKTPEQILGDSLGIS